MPDYPTICLIDVIKPQFVSQDAPLNLIMLASYLTEHHIVPKSKIHILNSGTTNVVNYIKRIKPDIIGMSVMTPFYPLSIEIAKEIKRNCRAQIIIGGYHITALPQLIDYPFDIGVIGEGEISLAKIVDTIKKHQSIKSSLLKRIPNLVFRTNKGKLVITDTQKILTPEEIPKIDFSLVSKNRLFKYQTIVHKGKPISVKIASLYTARGCPYHCAFCAHQILWRNQTGLRFFPIKRVGDEIEHLYRHAGINCIQILDDTFAVSKQRLKLLIGELEKRHLLGKIYFYNLFIRANIIDEEFVKLLNKFGASSVFIGIESGSTNILKYLKDGPLSPSQVKFAVKTLQKYNIFVVGSFMLFSPNETQVDIKKSYQLANWFSKQPNSYILLFSATTPYPGTKLWIDFTKNTTTRLSKHKWENYLMLDFLNSSKLPYRFYINKISSSQAQIWWTRFYDLNKNIQNKILSIPNYGKINQLTEMRHKRHISQIERDRAITNIYERLISFIKNPIVKAPQLITNHRLLSYVYNDLNIIFKSFK